MSDSCPINVGMERLDYLLVILCLTILLAIAVAAHALGANLAAA